MPYMKHTGIALATSLSSWCNVIYLLFSLKKLGTLKITCDTIVECVKQIGASIAMLAAIYGLNIAYANTHYINGGADRNIALLIVVCASCVVFYAVGKIAGIFRFMEAIKSLDKKEEGIK